MTWQPTQGTQPGPKRPNWIVRHKVWSAIIGAFILIVVIGGIAGGGGKSSSDGKTPASATVPSSIPTTASPSTSPTPKATPTSETSGKVLQHQQDVKITSCKPDELNDLNAKVKITNHSSKASDYDITVAFESKSGKTQYDTGDAFVQSLQPGQSTTQNAVSLTTAEHPYKCVLSSAERTESFD